MARAGSWVQVFRKAHAIVHGRAGMLVELAACPSRVKAGWFVF